MIKEGDPAQISDGMATKVGVTNRNFLKSTVRIGFNLNEARTRILKGQVVFLNRLMDRFQ
jgi:predicted NUDIX family NTP pyrophosphohydrolase